MLRLNQNKLTLKCGVRNLLNSLDMIGPSTDPCGTPEHTALDSEKFPLTTVLIERSFKKSSTVFDAGPVIPYLSSLAS